MLCSLPRVFGAADFALACIPVLSDGAQQATSFGFPRQATILRTDHSILCVSVCSIRRGGGKSNGIKCVCSALCLPITYSTSPTYTYPVTHRSFTPLYICVDRNKATQQLEMFSLLNFGSFTLAWQYPTVGSKSQIIIYLLVYTIDYLLSCLIVIHYRLNIVRNSKGYREVHG